MNTIKALLAGAALMASAAGANAATYYANNVVDAVAGVCEGTASGCAANDRKNTANAVDGDSNTFYSLGFGGSIVVSFAKPLFDIAQKVATFELTFNRDGDHDEAARVYSVLDGVETDLGVVTNAAIKSTVTAYSPFEFIKLVDVTKTVFPSSTSYDGFDVAQISVAAVPLPAAGLMLMGGLGGLAALRRRKKAA
ncbi:VPLPA-CTERM sorting domain-containing protein [Paracoccus beibuensis]|uniref:VPLPA-CTERM sorting domain-containing protein n=1 Tax=Paracoccus beibuensis TaxID=547602 RepID=UPI0022405962|nr:VPLPA-CTERM sorting domain-containing protein [Paracoccus beibuensis]